MIKKYYNTAVAVFFRFYVRRNLALPVRTRRSTDCPQKSQSGVAWFRGFPSTHDALFCAQSEFAAVFDCTTTVGSYDMML